MLKLFDQQQIWKMLWKTTSLSVTPLPTQKHQRHRCALGHIYAVLWWPFFWFFPDSDAPD